MISVWHLAATCCVPLYNPAGRLREQEIFQKVLASQSPHGGAKGRSHREEKEKKAGSLS